MFGVSFCSFFTNVYANHSLIDADYSWFVLFTIFLSYAASLIVLGADSVLLRYAKVIDGCIVISRNLLHAVIFSSLIGVLIFSFLAFSPYGFEVQNYEKIWFVAAIVLSSCLLLLSSVFIRLKKKYATAQFALNGWRILVFSFFSASFFIVVKTDRFIVEIFYSVSMILLASIFLIYSFRHIKINVVDGKETRIELFKFQFGSVIALAYFAVLSSFDRQLLSDQVSISDFNNYAYAIMLFTYPIGIIANYIGYKEIIEIKSGARVQVLYVALRLCLVGIVFFIFYSIILYIFRNLLKVHFAIDVWLASLAITSIRMAYSIYSAKFGAVASASDMLYANVSSIFIITILLVFATKYPSIRVICLLVPLGYFTRLLIVHMFLFKRKLLR